MSRRKTPLLSHFRAPQAACVKVVAIGSSFGSFLGPLWVVSRVCGQAVDFGGRLF